jgi:hypothetical protein
MNKSIFTSKTMWVNATTLVATATGFFAGSLSSHPDLVCWLVLIQAVANIILRWLTKEPVAMKATKPQTDVATSG